MQVSMLSKDIIPGPHRKFMQRSFTWLTVPSHRVPKKEQLGSWKGSSSWFAELLRSPCVVCQLHKKKKSRRYKNGFQKAKLKNVFPNTVGCKSLDPVGGLLSDWWISPQLKLAHVSPHSATFKYMIIINHPEEHLLF